MTHESKALRPSLPYWSASGRKQRSRPERLLSTFALGFVAWIAVWLVVLGVFNLHHPSDWAMGDWLINYSGGFVRRGLTGQTALLLRSLHVPLLWSVLLLQWALYAVVLREVWRLLRRTDWNWWKVALVFSPATLAFVLLDPPFAYRKDILFFALLAAILRGSTLWEAAEGKHPKSGRWSVLLTIGCAGCVLSHEGLIVFFPYLFAGSYLVSRDLRHTLKMWILPALVSVAIIGVISRFSGDLAVAKAVCTSIGGTWTTPPSGLCGGAIEYLAHDSVYAHHEVERVLLANHPWRLLPWLFLLPVVPIAMGLTELWRTDRQASRALLVAAIVASTASVSLFYYGTDWTRWIYLPSFSLMLLLLYAAQRRRHTATEMSVLFAPRRVPRWIAWTLLLVYCLGWQVTTYSPRPLYGSFVRFITHNMARGQQ